MWQQSRDKSLPDSKKSLEHSDASVISHVLESILTLSGSSSQKLLGVRCAGEESEESKAQERSFRAAQDVNTLGVWSPGQSQQYAKTARRRKERCRGRLRNI